MPLLIWEHSVKHLIYGAVSYNMAQQFRNCHEQEGIWDILSLFLYSSLPHTVRVQHVFTISGLPFHPNQRSMDWNVMPCISFIRGKPLDWGLAPTCNNDWFGKNGNLETSGGTRVGGKKNMEYQAHVNSQQSLNCWVVLYESPQGDMKSLCIGSLMLWVTVSQCSNYEHLIVQSLSEDEHNMQLHPIFHQ